MTVQISQMKGQLEQKDQMINNLNIDLNRCN